VALGGGDGTVVMFNVDGEVTFVVFDVDGGGADGGGLSLCYLYKHCACGFWA